MTRVVVAGYQDEIFIKMIHGTQQIYIFFLTFVNGLLFLQSKVGKKLGPVSNCKVGKYFCVCLSIKTNSI